MKRKILSIALCLSMIISMVVFAPISFAVADGEFMATTEQTTLDATEDNTGDIAAPGDQETTPAPDADAVTPAEDQDADSAAAEVQPGVTDANDSIKDTTDAVTETNGDSSEKYAGSAVNYTNVAKFVGVVAPIRKAARLVARAASNTDNGVEFTKTVTSNKDGTFTIQMEAFTTGKVTVSSETKPSDIVLVLDRSTSMKSKFGSTTYEPVYVLDKSKTYYVKKDNSYKSVTWCRSCGAWTSGCREGFISHKSGEKYTPKDSENSSGDQFYEKITTRMDALHASAKKFVESVSKNSPDSRIAVVSFGNEGYTHNELLSVKDGKGTIIKSIDYITADEYATEHGKGMIKAQDVLKSSEPNYNRVVVMITDGEPAPYGSNNWSGRIVKEAVNTSLDMKTAGVSVYCVSVMPGTDAGNPTSPMDKYMDYVSSNYPKAKYTGNFIGEDSDGNKIINQITPGTKIDTTKGSFYLSAGNVDALDKIFEQIASQTGGSTTSLGTSAVVRDVMTPYFTVPEARDVTVESVDCTSYNESTKTAEWGTRTTLSNDCVKVSENTIDVSGFDFDHNFIAEKGRTEGDVTADGTFHGRKLVIKFTVKPKEGFLGGNGVPTNEKAELLESANAPNSVKTATADPVDVPLKTLDVKVADKNIYLFGNMTNDQLKEDVVATFNGKSFAELEVWQKAFVKDPVVTVNGGVTKAKEDAEYSATVILEPKGTGTATATKSNTKTAKINVFKPELTYKDVTRYYGETADNAKVLTDATVGGIAWKHGATAATDVTMTGTAPTVVSTAAIVNPGDIKNGVFNTADDSYYKVTSKIGADNIDDYVIYKHQACTTNCGFNSDKGQFIVHKKTCTLNVAKKVAGSNNSDSFAMKITGITEADFDDFEVLVKGGETVTVKGLPIGTYTVTEDTNWAWRYTVSGNGATAELSPANNNGTVTITNTLKENKWLNFVTSVQNLFTKAK